MIALAQTLDRPTLRGYQLESKQEIHKAIGEGHKTLIVQQPTGTGKTVQQVDLVLDEYNKGNQVLIVVPSKELVKNMATEFLNLGIRVSYIQGSRATIWTNKVYIGTVKTIYNRLRDGKFPLRFDPTLILHDECQHAPSNQWRKIIEVYKSVVQIGFSATPCRLDGKPFSELFTHLIPGKSIAWFIQNGFLCPYRLFILPVLEVKFKKVRGDFSLAEQSSVYDDPRVIGDVVSTWQENSPGEKTIVFATGVDHSRHIVEAYNELGRSLYGRDIAAHVDADTPDRERDNILERFKLPIDDPNGLMIVSNVQLFTEGVNVPDCTVVQLCRLTASLSLFLQMVGRGLRWVAGKILKLYDHVGNIGIHKRPDYERRWTLEGAELVEKKPNPNEIACGVCDTVVIKDRRKHQPGDIVTCETCGADVMVPFPRERGARKPIEHDTSQKLVEMSSDNLVRYEINALVLRSSKMNRDKFLKQLALIKGLSYEDVIYACECKDYNRAIAIAFWSRQHKK